MASVAEHERISLESVQDIGTINFLNDLAYLKDKARHEKEAFDKWRQKEKNSRA